ncbi:MAG: acyl CoA--acetate/3-ketoacid CoA transferase subunit beta [Chloroflexi bacterium]|nr:acyl CoA--acetate/3-ketoacid CoA transferase subunit beta [Chloroflexota bacterium]
MSTALAFTDNEATIAYTSRLMEEDKLYFVAIGGPPLLGILLAKQLRAPAIAYVVEDGTIAPQMPMPTPPFMIGAGLASSRAVAWTDMNTVDFHAGLGYLDYGVLAAVQVDQYGNFNSTFTGGTFDHPVRRFGGPGGANEIAALCWRTVLMTRLQKRKFVNRLDFMSSPGFLDGSPGARERAGMPPGTGPYRVVTERAMFGFDEATRRMKLIAVAPWTSVEEVLADMEFAPIVASDLGVLDPPTDEELEILRTQVDPTGRTIAGEWIMLEETDAGLRRVATEAVT